MNNIFFSSNLDYLLKLKEKEKGGSIREDLAGLLNRKVNTISNYVTGVSVPKLDKLITIINFFDTSLDLMVFTDMSSNPTNEITKVVDQSILQESKLNYGNTTQGVEYNINSNQKNLDEVLEAKNEHINTLKENIKHLKEQIQFQNTIISNSIKN